jgi:surface polysaccharide O-acyltransferase-like enzyme
VVLHHLAITYGAPGSWYYNESQAGMPEIVLLSLFVVTNQSFFMGMFFFISALFILPSLSGKGTSRFIRERLLRLGIPLVLYFFIISPLTVFINHRYIQRLDVSLLQYISGGNGAGFGPMWFVEALLVFSLVFLLVRPVAVRINLPFPRIKTILMAAVFTGLLQFLLRIELPVGWSMPFTDFQLPFFVQYMLLFALGIIAQQNNWLDAISTGYALKWFLFAQGLIFVGFPLLLIGGGFTSLGTDAFMGGFTWQSLGYALWEQLLGFSLIIALFGLFKKHFNRQGNTARFLSRSAYGVFIIHPFVLVAISAFFVSWNAPPLVKLIVLAPLALMASFLGAGMLHRIPLLRKIL